MRIFAVIIMILMLVMSVPAVMLTVKDKLAAKKRARRVPERTLMLVGAFGGAFAMLLTMLVIRHKTKHVKFMLGLPLFIAVHAALLILCILL